MSLFQKMLHKGGQSWVVILKEAPDKRAEEALIRIFTERLDIPGDDALKIVRSAPIILFDERNGQEAGEIKMVLNETGARTTVTNDPGEIKKLPRVVWPKKVELTDLKAGGGSFPEAPPPFTLPKPSKPITPTPKPVVPTQPKTMPMPPPVTQASPSEKMPPPSVSGEWKSKYENLQQSYLSAIDRLERKEAELQTTLNRAKQLEQEMERFQEERPDRKVQELELKLRDFTQEKDLLIRERDLVRERAEGTEKELSALRNLQSALEKEKETLEGEKEHLVKEKEHAVSVREHAEKAAEGLRKELAEAEALQESLQKEIERLRAEKERPLAELEKIKAALEAQLETFERQADPLKSQLERVGKLLEILRSPPKGPGSRRIVAPPEQ